MKIDRRKLMIGAAAFVAAPHVARAATIKDSAGREVVVSTKVERVFPAGPPAAILTYTLAPKTLLGWPRANRAADLAFLDPEVGARPEVGRLTGRGNTTNLEVLLQLKPDLIVDSGSVTRTYAELASRVQAQTGIPYVLLDGGFARTPESYRLLGELMGLRDRAQELARYCEETMATCRSRIAKTPIEKRPRVYYARGPRGLETGVGSSINVETLTFMGAINVASEMQGGLATVSMEQALNWNPDIIVTIDPTFAANVRNDPLWRNVAAVRAGRVHLSPRTPFGWVDFPPSVNRMAGLWWLGKILYPELFPEDLAAVTRDFYTRFYHRTPTDEQIALVLAGQG